ncbi:MAG: molybdate ABC transporter substrate-binding protein [Pseudomonadota bacterium]
MRAKSWTLSALVCLLVLLNTGLAQALTIAAGAGYRRPVSELAAQFQADTGIKVDLVLGNMGQVMSQIKAGAPVDLMLGDQAFLKKSGLAITTQAELGQGRLVLAHAKGVRLDSPQDLARQDIKRVAIPDQAKAIYGKAGHEFLERAGLAKAVRDKLLVVGTVPQVSTYLISGEVDAGLLNLTDVLGIKDKIGGYLLIDPGLYDPIHIVVGLLASAPRADQARRFLEFAASSAARSIVAAHGL